jgi:hypothetical protein
MFFLKAFEIEYDRGKVVLVWSGLDDTERDMYNVRPRIKSVVTAYVAGVGLQILVLARLRCRSMFNTMHRSRCWTRASRTSN